MDSGLMSTTATFSKFQTVTDNQKESLQWIVSILNKHNIPFQISGGLAAKIYGSTRPLNDIDIDVPEGRIPELLDDVKEYITFGPAREIDRRWDIYVLTFTKNQQEFDICGVESVKIFDASADMWRDFPSDIGSATWVEYMGMKLPVIQKQELIEYKKLLEGEHQKVDIQAISSH